MTCHFCAARAKGDCSRLARVEALAEQRLPDADSGLCALLPMIGVLGNEPFSVWPDGFIAQTLLLSLIARGALSADGVSHFQAGVRTVAGDLVDDMRRLQISADLRGVHARLASTSGYL